MFLLPLVSCFVVFFVLNYYYHSWWIKMIIKKSAMLDTCVVISPKRCETESQLLLLTNRNLHTGSQLLPKSMTVNDFKRFSIVISRHKHITGAFIYKFYSPTDVGSTAQQHRTKINIRQQSRIIHQIHTT